MTAELFNHLWQSTWFALIACGLILLLRKGSSWSRHFIAWAAILKFLVPFSLINTLIPSQIAGSLLSWLSFLRPKVQEQIIPMPVNLDLVAAQPSPVETSTSIPLAILLLFFWFLGFTLLFARRSAHYHQCKTSIFSNSYPASKGWQNMAQVILGPDHNTLPKIVISNDDNLNAGVFGLINTTIVIPEKMNQAFDANDREAFLRHELQHVLKHDNLWLFLQKGIRDLFWFHPLVYWLDRQISSEREMMRDEEVLQETNNIKSYINCLMKASKIDLPDSYATSLGIKGSPFTRRLKAIAGYQSNFLKKFLSGTVSIFAVGILSASILVSTISVQANEERSTEDNPSVKHLLRKHLELAEEMEKAKSSLNETAEEYEKTHSQLRRALLSDNFDEDLSPDEAELADRFLARLEQQMDRNARRDEDREREEIVEYRIGREKLRKMESQLGEINAELDWLSEQAEDRNLTDREQAKQGELKRAKDSILQTLDKYHDKHSEDRGDI